ncbi:MAG: MBL fold metallo-hydrolase, partial [Candidatus Omnitrophica bacterium]|nr:MBL fold metallo-hydrolase [Candidatus Omnitrophota bacterium]
FLVAAHFLQARWLYVHILDVGHGDCILIQTPQGQTFMVDAGSQEAGKRHVVPVLRTMGIRRLDALILTHSDEDHIGGAIPLGNAMRLSRLLTNGASSATMSAKTLREWVAEGKIPHQVVASGAQLRNKLANGSPSSFKLEVLHPPKGFTPGTAPEANDNSIVLRLSYGEVGFLLAGDIEEEGLRWLLEQPVELKSMVLKVPHHGSRLGAIGELFFRKVDPEIAILSVGRAHHLPSRQTLEALQATRARLFSTLHDGAVSLRTDGRCLEVKTFRGSKKWEQVSEWY